jgi:hypothetical protein
MTLTMRGDSAVSLGRALRVTPRADIERGFKQSISASSSWLTIEKMDFAVSPEGIGKVTVTGTADLDWRMNDDVGVKEYRLPGSGSGKATTFPRREPAPTPTRLTLPASRPTGSPPLNSCCPTRAKDTR